MQASQRKLTHFLSLPLGHHAGLRERVTKFTSALLNSPRRIPGLHETIVMKPHRMRFNLGVMPLDDGTDVSGDDGAGGSPRTLDDARALLAALRPRLLKIISSPSYGTSTPGKLRAPLTQMSISNAVKGDPRQAHALYLGLPEGAELRILSAVANEARRTFVEAGFLQENQRLRLRGNILNTTYREPHTLGRTAFDYLAILSSPAMTEFRIGPPPEWVSAEARRRFTPKSAQLRGPPPMIELPEPVLVDFGTWDVDELQICKVLDDGPRGEYVCVEKISLV